MGPTKSILVILALVCSVCLDALSFSRYVWETTLGGELDMTNHEGCGELFIFSPVLQSSEGLVFVQLDGGYFRNQYGFCAGLGTRRFIGRKAAWGINGFLDYANSNHSVDHFQLGAGAELLGPCWTIRANGYYPWSKKRLVGTGIQLGALARNNPGGAGVDIFSADTGLRRFERSYKGFDIEGGAFIDFGPGEVWGYLGYYLYAARGTKVIMGPRLRAEYRSKPFIAWGGEVYAAYEWSYDRLRNTEGMAIFGVRIPICWRSRTRNWAQKSLCRRMNWNVHRRRGVYVAVERQKTALPNEFLQTLAFAQGGAVVATGTQADPTTLANAVATAGANGIVFLLNTNGAMTGLVLGANQTVAGFGDGMSALVPVRGDRSLTITPLAGQTGRPTITGTTTMTTSGILFGFNLTGPAAGLLGTAITGANINDINFSSAGDNILFTQSGAATNSTILITNSTFTSAGGNGIAIPNTGAGGTTNVLIENNTFTAVSARPIELSSIVAAVPNPPTTYNARIIGNVVTGGAAALDAIRLRSEYANPGDTFVALVENNTLTPTLGANGVTAEGNMSGVLAVTLTNNSANGAGAGTGYNISRGLTAGGTVCTNLSGNTSDMAIGALLDQNTPTLQIVDRDNVAANNTLSNVSIPMSAENITAAECPLPPAIP